MIFLAARRTAQHPHWRAPSDPAWLSGVSMVSHGTGQLPAGDASRQLRSGAAASAESATRPITESTTTTATGRSRSSVRAASHHSVFASVGPRAHGP